MAAPFPLGNSLWADTAPSPLQTPRLTESLSAGAVIVGGGYAGLSAGLHLAEKGTRAIVLEAHEPGWGGSGRNGGQVIPGLKYDPGELEKMFGPIRGPRLVEFAGGTADVVFNLIEKHRMDVPRQRQGWIQGAHREAGVEMVKRRAAQWGERGVEGARFLDREE